jgi:hypothetical protein
MQSPREFNTLLRDSIAVKGWQLWMSDPCTYIFRTWTVFAMIALFVGDIPAACNGTKWLVTFKAQLGANFKVNDLGELSLLMGMHTTRGKTARSISMNQSKYVKDIMSSIA